MVDSNEAARIVLFINQLPPEYKIEANKLNDANPNVVYKFGYQDFASVVIPVSSGMFITEVGLSITEKFNGISPTMALRLASNNSVFAASQNFNIARTGVQKVSVFKPILADDFLYIDLSSGGSTSGVAYLSLIKGQLK